MLMQGRHWENSHWERFGYNGMEKDDEIKGKGNSYTTEFRMYDSRLCRWLSTDPIFHEWESPYAGMGNNPVVFVDPEGTFYITEHLAMDYNALDLLLKNGTISIFQFASLVKYSIGFQTNRELFEGVIGYNPLMHLDNMTNQQFRSFLSVVGYSNLDNHQIADFYSHSNYVELLMAKGISPDKMPLFDELDKNSELYKYVIQYLRTTNYPDKIGDKYSHGLGVEKGITNETPDGGFKAKDNTVTYKKDNIIVQNTAYNLAQKAIVKWWEINFNNPISNSGNERKWIEDNPLRPGHWEDKSDSRD